MLSVYEHMNVYLVYGCLIQAASYSPIPPRPELLAPYHHPGIFSTSRTAGSCSVQDVLRSLGLLCRHLGDVCARGMVQNDLKADNITVSGGMHLPVVHAIDQRFDNKVSSQTRTEAWEHITAALNAAFPHSQRIPNQVEKKWYSLKSEGKEEISTYNKVLKGTGGGDPPKPLSDVATLVQTILGPENVCISGIAELDAVSLQNGNTASAGSEHDLTANNKTVAEMAVIEIDQCDELEVQLCDDNAKLPNISVAGTAIKPPPPPSAHKCCSTCNCSTACEKAVLELELLRAQVAAAKAQAHAFDMWSEKIKSQMKK
ncbi:uncharacterized protein LOC123500949 [Portunus trituberculatus]|uniref:uncharacterized protein LOC123500949 n=1 Tax=Portunus trituberculatus TaxID=210409 RepID=UPI001E1D0962|nr:uncharacterized protein LOC123500949 [Portunus trituberculatus]